MNRSVTVRPTEKAIRRTEAFARVIGPFLVVVAAIIAVRLPNLDELVHDLFANALLPWMLGATMLGCGLVIIAFHQYWYSMAAPSSPRCSAGSSRCAGWR